MPNVDSWDGKLTYWKPWWDAAKVADAETVAGLCPLGEEEIIDTSKI